MPQSVSLDVTRFQIKRWIIRWIELAPRDRLSAAFIKSAKPGKHCNGAGLWFHKRANGGAQWFLRFDRYGKRCDMGLGEFPFKLEARPHGFRSTLRVWLTESLQASREVAETIIAHQTGSLTERAYNCTDFLEQRRELMEVWEKYLNAL